MYGRLFLAMNTGGDLLRERVEHILNKMESDEDKAVIARLLQVAEEARGFVESGSGTYALMKTVVTAYEPEKINLHLWTR